MTSKKKKFEALQAQAHIFSTEVEGLQYEVEEAQMNVPDNLQDSALMHKLDAQYALLGEMLDALEMFTDIDWSNPE